ncbi:DUF4254 domain-containing protein [Flavitalea sp. BT771]|uniref:DUF4254 domain-containing protein n=1 Tax=Flavitalea sp. BT771 TaxID=3063329 RepID=UPI0026E3058A|nr:DUF4254 domain-containing protein [Flavitalea sp. BT771]MDO6434601.1 DUF4254 domain-containing protein [Flavitalea sp. BT771]MDV6223501.1 DUF4254 domain-containing protein [Flavitalea sp. BT771]
MQYLKKMPPIAALSMGETFSRPANTIYEQVIDDYHLYDDPGQAVSNPFPAGTIEYLLYQKCWIDCLQWHVEDAIRHPDIEPREALACKRRIDALNQDRTNTVERMDDHFLTLFREVPVRPSAKMNSESPAWALDRLSILALKIYHMRIETRRTNADEQHIHQCTSRLRVLADQQLDLLRSIDELLQDIARGDKYMKVYRQMKMYNDPNLNPVLYNSAGH